MGVKQGVAVYKESWTGISHCVTTVDGKKSHEMSAEGHTGLEGGLVWNVNRAM